MTSPPSPDLAIRREVVTSSPNDSSAGRGRPGSVDQSLAAENLSTFGEGSSDRDKLLTVDTLLDLSQRKISSVSSLRKSFFSGQGF